MYDLSDSHTIVKEFLPAVYNVASVHRDLLAFVWRSGLWLHNCQTWILFRLYDIDLLLCLVSLSCCMTQFGPRFSYQTDDLRIFWYTKKVTVDSMTAGCLDPVAAKQAEIIIAPSPCLTVDWRCLCWYVCFSPTMHPG